MLLDTARPSSLAEENASTTGVSAGRRSLASDLDDSMMFGGDVDLDGEGGDDDDGFIQQLASAWS